MVGSASYHTEATCALLHEDGPVQASPRHTATAKTIARRPL